MCCLVAHTLRALSQETVDAGAHEFAETEQFLRAAEDVCGPYVWGNYDILLLPPSFPYGGMENPQVRPATAGFLAESLHRGSNHSSSPLNKIKDNF